MCKRTVDKQEYNVAGSLRLVDIFISVTLACDLKSGEVKGQGHQASWSSSAKFDVGAN